MFPEIYLSGKPIESYVLMHLLGFILAAIYLWKTLRAQGIPRSQLSWAIGIGIFVQDLGGTLIPYAYRLIYMPNTVRWGIGPGRYFHSIILSMILYIIVLSKIWKWPKMLVLDRFMIAAMIMSPMGRVGCFLQGCCLGKPSALPWAVRFPFDPGVPRHPVQLYMLALELGVLVYLVWQNKKPHRDGEVFWKGVLVYSVYRFLIEFWRTNPEFILTLTHAQVFSLAMIPVAGFFLKKSATKTS